MLKRRYDNRLSTGVTDILDQVTVDVAGLTADIADETIEAETFRALRTVLGDAIYRHFHQGSAHVQPQSPHAFRDRTLEERLKSSIPYKSIAVPGRRLGTRGTSALIEIDHVRVWVPANRVRSEKSIAGGAGRGP